MDFVQKEEIYIMLKKSFELYLGFFIKVFENPIKKFTDLITEKINNYIESIHQAHDNLIKKQYKQLQAAFNNIQEISESFYYIDNEFLFKYILKSLKSQLESDQMFIGILNPKENKLEIIFQNSEIRLPQTIYYTKSDNVNIYSLLILEAIKQNKSIFINKNNIQDLSKNFLHSKIKYPINCLLAPISLHNLKSKNEIIGIMGICNLPNENDIESDKQILMIMAGFVGFALMLKKTIKDKSDFIAKISHDIRAPLNGIIGCSESLTDTKLDEKQLILTQVIQTCGNQLLNTINNCLDFSKMQNDKLDIIQKSFDLKLIIDQVMLIIKNLADKKNIKLEYIFDHNIPKYLIGDEEKIKRILINLLHNSIKATSKGKVSIKVKLLSNKNNISKIQFVIADTGIGIPPDKQKIIFQAYLQTISQYYSSQTGTGLGLAISKEFVELMGGKIFLKSYEKKGSKFWFILPLEIELSKNILTTDIDKDKFKNNFLYKIKKYLLQHQINILVADDEDTNHIVISNIFEKLKIKYTIVTNGIEVLQQLQAQKFDLLLLDVHMPLMDGWETINNINNFSQHDLNYKIDTYILTGDAHINQKKYQQAGLKGIIVKPYTHENIYHILDKTFVANMKVDLNINFADLEKFIPDPELRNKILSTFASHIPNYISSIQQLYENKDYTKLSFLLHKLKNPAMNCKAYKLEEIVNQAENKLFAQNYNISDNITEIIKELTIINKLIKEEIGMRKN